MNAVILAAGMGKRLKQYTKDNTKCMIKVNGESLIERMLKQLDKYNLSRIIIVVGYKKDELIEYVSTLNINTPIEYVVNEMYEQTNNIYSLSLVKDRLLDSDTIVLESDIIFEDSVLDAVIYNENKSVVLVDKYENWMDGSCVTLNSDLTISSFIKKEDFDFSQADTYYKTVNIYKFSKDFSSHIYIPYMEIYLSNFGKNIYYEEVLSAVSMLKNPEIIAKIIDGKRWYEIDDEQDLDIANTLFSSAESVTSEYSNRHGGFWRFNQLLDYRYLVNPYYPSGRLLLDIKCNASNLIMNYPSGRSVISKLASNHFNVKDNQIIVGNGAAELINILVQNISGAIGIINPSFEEYKNRVKNNNIVYLETETINFKYTQDTIINYYSNNKVDNIVLINPDIPSGNYIPIGGLHKLLNWTNENNIRLIIDESFIDFSNYENDSVLDSRILDDFPNLVVIKSISKSHGIPGLRLGILATSDYELMKKISDELSIWNINSFAEYYLQVMDKYDSDFNASLQLVKKERARFYQELTKISNIEVYPSEANYFMIRLLNGISARAVTEKLLSKYNILIKNLDSKLLDKNLNLIRVSIRNENENNEFIKAFKEVIKEEK